MKKLLILLAALIILLGVGKQLSILPEPINKIFESPVKKEFEIPEEKRTIIQDESNITSVIEEALPSVVTIGIKTTTTTGSRIEIDPFDPFSPFREIPGQQKKVERNIGSGFIISSDGLIITNRHVVGDTQAEYRVLTNDRKEYEVKKIYRDPLNDLSILKINAQGLKALPLGDSSKLKLGQTAIAIGTPLGVFTNTVTVGIISGLGRGIVAGSPLEGFVEKLDNVIQTDAAISGGNSGGPLLDSVGNVIGVNTAVAVSGENLGFAIPSNVVRNLIDSFEKRGGSFERPYIGVRYQIIDKKTAIANKLVEGAYVVEVIENSPADKAGILEEDIIVEFDGKKISGDDEDSLAKAILEKNVGVKVPLTIWRDNKTQKLTLTLEATE